MGLTEYVQYLLSFGVQLLGHVRETLIHAGHLAAQAANRPFAERQFLLELRHCHRVLTLL